MARAALLLLPALALAGCGGTAPGNDAGAANAAMENAASENAAAGNTAFAAETRGWDDLFARPAKDALAIFEKLSLRPGAYEAMGDSHMSHGTPIDLADTASGKRNNTLTFGASGDEKRLRGVSFDVTIADPKTAGASRRRALDSIVNALGIAGLDGADVVRAALADNAKSTAGSVAGANYTVIAKGERTTITFTHKQST